ncbi:MAG: 2'-5' RNA ligase family protein [Actinomycetota bacterium]
MAFEAGTYVCLDVPEPVASRIMEIRRRHRDGFRAALPVEITVAGSGGVDVIEPGQDPATVLRLLDEIAARTPPIVARFGDSLRFPGTDVFVFALEDPAPFEALHGRIISSGIRFKPSPHGFFPHCTLRSRSPVTEAEAEDLMQARIERDFVLRGMALYVLDGLPMSVMHTGELTG